MTISTLPLSYCTNVHPGMTVDEVVSGLNRYTSEVKRVWNQPLAAGLWLAKPVIDELTADPTQLEQLQNCLSDNNLVCHTLNAFPYGNFHSERVKENVYIPTWTAPERLEYTSACARVLASLMPEGCEGSISTVPLGFKDQKSAESHSQLASSDTTSLCCSQEFVDSCCQQIIELAVSLDELHDDTGKMIRLAIEPEPLCVLETTPETIRFFNILHQRATDAGQLDIVKQHIGVCYDVCHQSVEFEDVAQSIQDLEQAGIRIVKVHITCAIELDDPKSNHDGRQALANYVEPRYLHQTTAKTDTGNVLRVLDLSETLALEPTQEMLNVKKWRIHFHVPVDAESIGPLSTTRADLKLALKSVAKLSYAPHLEVETYTWNVLPGQAEVSLVDGLVAELAATQLLLKEIAETKPPKPPPLAIV